MFNDISKVDEEYLYAVKGSEAELIEFIEQLESTYIRSQKGYMLTTGQITGFKESILANKDALHLINFYTDFDFMELVIESEELQVKLPFYLGELNILVSEVPIYNYSLDRLITLEGSFTIHNLGIFTGGYTIYKGESELLIVKSSTNEK